MQSPIISPEFDDLNNYFNKLIENKTTAGIIFLLYKKGETKFLQKYGWQDIENNILIDFNTIFRIYSMTKPVITVALMKLFEEGKFNLHDPISKFLPEFLSTEVFVKEENDNIITEKVERDITVINLLTHTAGLCYGSFEEDPVDKLYIDKLTYDKKKNLTLDKVVKIISSLPLRFHPSDFVRYSYGIDVLGRLIEVLSEKDLDEYLHERIFEPLEMSDTAFNVPEEKVNRFTQIYVSNKESKFIQLLNTPNVIEPYKKGYKFLSGGGGLVSTTKDFFNFTLMFLNKGTFKGKQFLKSETIDLMVKNHLKDGKTILEQSLDLDRFATKNFKLDGYGTGFAFRVRIREGSIPTPIGEYGMTGAAHTCYWIDPANEIIGIFMTQVLSAIPSVRTIDMEQVIQLAYSGLNHK
jgi:CubicO group peptidase (beta-lactamase class C family)